MLKPFNESRISDFALLFDENCTFIVGDTPDIIGRPGKKNIFILLLFNYPKMKTTHIYMEGFFSLDIF